MTENKYIVSTAENADNAKEKLDFLKFDIIILDVMMPGQNGYELTKEIKRNTKIPVIEDNHAIYWDSMDLDSCFIIFASNLNVLYFC